MASHRMLLSASQLTRHVFGSSRCARPAPNSGDQQRRREFRRLLFTAEPPSRVPPAAQSIYQPPSTTPPVSAQNQSAREVMASLPAYRLTLHDHLLAHMCDDGAAGVATPSADHDAGGGGSGESAPTGALHRLKLSAEQLRLSPETLSDADIVQLLMEQLVDVGGPDGSSILLNQLGGECCRRLPRWTSDQALLLADVWSGLRGEGAKLFGRRVMVELGGRVQQLNSSQLVQYMFCANIQRSLRGVNQLQLESQLLRSLSSMSIDELGVVCLGFFMTRSPLRSSQLVEAVARRLMLDVQHAKQETVSAILKIIRYSIHAPQWQLVMEVYDRLLPLLPGFNQFVQVHLLLLGIPTQTEHAMTVRRITAYMHGQLSVVRLKEIERLLLVIMTYNFDPGADFFSDLVAELETPKRVNELIIFSKNLMSAITYLSYYRVYPRRLIDTVLSPEFIRNAGSWAGFDSDSLYLIVTLNYNLELEMDGFQSPLPPEFIAGVTSKWLCHDDSEQKRLTYHDKLTERIHSSLVEALGSAECTAKLHVLPHFTTPDIVVCVDNAGGPVQLPDAFLQLPATSLKRPTAPQPGQRWLCVVIGGRSSYTSNSRKPVGKLLLRIRQLRLLGYSVVEVPFYEFHLTRSPVKYMQQKLRSVRRTSR